MKSHFILIFFILSIGNNLVNCETGCARGPLYSGYSVKHCPDGWVRYRQEKSFKLNTNFQRPRTWTEAKEFCEQNGSTLASVHSEEEREFLKTYFSRELYTRTDTRDTWIGGFKMGPDWNWVDLTQFDFKDWLPGHPSYEENKCLSLSTWSGHIKTGKTRFGKINDHTSCNGTLLLMMCQQFQVDARKIVYAN